MHGVFDSLLSSAQSKAIVLNRLVFLGTGGTIEDNRFTLGWFHFVRRTGPLANHR